MRSLILSCLALFAVSGFSWAKEKPWKFSSETSYINTTGNTRTETIGTKNAFDYDWTKTALRTKANAMGSQEDRKTTAENYFAEEKYEWKFKKPNYLFQLGSWEKDRFAGIDHRLTAGGGLGRKLLDLKRHSLIFELGLQHSWEDRRKARSEKFGSARAYADYHWILSETAEFSQSVEYLDDFESSDAYRVNAITAIKTALTTHLSFKASYEIKYNNDPPPLITKTDTQTILALVIDF